MKKAYVNATIYASAGIIPNGRMLVDEDGRISAIGDAGLELPEGTQQVDLGGRTVIPGLVDVHVHGGGGHHVMKATYESLDGMSRFHAKHGTTSFLATTTTDSAEDISAALRTAATSSEQGLSGAEMVGVHLEGPFLNLKRAGAQDPSTILNPDLALLETFLNDAGGLIRLVTLAPELGEGMQMVKYLSERGITASLGHSDASFDETSQAVSLGASHTTHHFNGMRPMHHREPGLAGAGMMLSELTTELIADGMHVHPALAKLLFEVKGADKLCCVTDAVDCAGLPDGVYGHKQMVNGQVTLLEGDSLAGSSLTMIQALRNMLRFTEAPLEKLLPSFTTTPARQAGCADRKGSLTPGKDADFLVVDEELNVISTYVRGNAVYSV